MKRRTFIKNSVGATISGAAVVNGLYMNQLFGKTSGHLPSIDIPSPHLTRLKVKPIQTNMYHTAEWEGPCRFNVVGMEEEKARAISYFDYFKGIIKKNEFGINLNDVDIMDPSLVLSTESFEITEEQYRQIDIDAREADVLLVDPAGASIYAYKLAEKYEKPIVLSGALNCRSVDVAAYSRSKGHELYVANQDYSFADIFNLLRARKVFKDTRILYPTDRGWPSVASLAGINDPYSLKDLYGIGLEKISFTELASEMDRLAQNSHALGEADKIAETMFGNAEHAYLKEKHVAKSMVFYQAVINLMKKHNCNSFTIECFEFCVSRLPQKWNITPCLIHTMFKDLGIPSACEGDLGGLLSMHMLMSVSKKSAHMGNMFYDDGGE
ncbi:hypothetical protein ACFLT1_10040 [Bacteroidota bacterium]